MLGQSLGKEIEVLLVERVKSRLEGLGDREVLPVLGPDLGNALPQEPRGAWGEPRCSSHLSFVPVLVTPTNLGAPGSSFY